MEESFLLPWTSVLKTYIHPVLANPRDGIHDPPQRILPVSVFPGFLLDADDQSSRTRTDGQTVREGLKLLAAVAHVDTKAWKYILLRQCEVRLGREWEAEFDNEVLVRYQVKLGAYETPYVADLARHCGTRQHDAPRKVYLDALARIAAMDSRLRLDKPGVEIQIPVQVESDLAGLSKVRKTKKLIEKEFDELGGGRLTHASVEPLSLRCTFVLEPVVVWEGFKLITDPAIDGSERKKKRVFGRLMTSLFDSSRRCRGLLMAHALDSGAAGSRRLQQIDKLSLQTYRIPQRKEFEAMCSAMARSQTIRKLTLSLLMSWNNDADDSAHWWKWVAYTFFSKRACSSLEALRLTWLARMTVSDVDAFCSVLQSEHPEEELCGCPRGGGGGTRRNVVHFVKTFSDDGESEWVNALIPGYGRCQVQREKLEFNAQGPSLPSSDFTTLEIGFDRSATIDNSGLPLFLVAIGLGLRVLTIDSTFMAVDVDMVLERCPNLQMLTIRRLWVTAQLNFAEYQAADCGIAKCLQRLYVRQNYRPADQNWRTNPALLHDLIAFMQMLERNNRLELFSLKMFERFEQYSAIFRNFHLQRMGKKPVPLALKGKLALLSALEGRPADETTKRRRHQVNLQALDVNVVSQIFAFAQCSVKCISSSSTD
ncbi:hypothetical protein PHYSODRAFT_339871 [Phytophthora sojae]|uniref:Uncharacterized protein n=1 Tax=Phytophthora sojae (strain P6497) TaxID=1094619 RepID=G5A7W3_PHYSP|nr:hypothetical protein PHYSODRAFT_339871 [Phytophthora sojae]EGZ07989.1 hypothetical protein PHYSODRAFT_339871 [Phytophthora sojae]|eukprot:XP_009536161.1 hypothetical protein PHYSODRAFT_339871 [Phytophthora sojae]